MSGKYRPFFLGLNVLESPSENSNHKKAFCFLHTQVIGSFPSVTSEYSGDPL